MEIINCPVCGKEYSSDEKWCSQCAWELQGDFVFGGFTEIEQKEYTERLEIARKRWQELQSVHIRQGDILDSLDSEQLTKIINKSETGLIAYVKGNLDDYSSIYTMDSEGKNSKLLTESLTYCYSPVWSPDGEKIAFINGSKELNQICVIKHDGGDLRSLTPMNARYMKPFWSPDSKQLCTISNEREDLFNSYHHIYIIDVENGITNELLPSTKILLEDHDEIPIWLIFKTYSGSWVNSGDGILFPWIDNENMEIFFIKPDGSQLKKITHFNKMCTQVSVSPILDRYLIIVEEDNTDRYEIVFMKYPDIFIKQFDVESNDLSPTLDIDCPKWSPRGKNILYSFTRPEGSWSRVPKFAILNLDNYLIDQTLDGNEPEFSLNGNTIVFQFGSDIMKIDTNRTVNLMKSGYKDYYSQPAWQPKISYR